MIHIIRVDTLENLINDLCSFLRVSHIELCNKILDMYSECQGSEHYYFDDEKFFDLSSDFIKSHPLSRTILIVDSSTKKKCDIMKDALPTGRIGQR